ncbi:MAG: aryl-alcohol dehydrogenase-like predicted oxidoreductase [Planctomycetota bacterium]|jgi:aryl-alcohol dehydrogenase-like predicted oxidoreductase|tara:strand:+ start:1915 stop:2769 length:855 start_codon:yes stop_codon:yes gene_type:complete
MKEFLSRIGFGCVGLTALDSKRSALDILEVAYSNGIRHFDTADIYGRGYSEIILSKFIKNKRDNLHIATKFGLGNHQNNILPVGFAIKINKLKREFITKERASNGKSMSTSLKESFISKDYVRRSLEDSLNRLKTHYLDYYFLHEHMPSNLGDEAKDFLLELKEKGIVNNLGIGSSFSKFSQQNIGDLNIFDTIQYEAVKSNINISVNKKIIIHSLFNFYDSYNIKQIPEKERFGFLIALTLLKNPGSKVIFSSSKIINIENNIKYAYKYFSDIDVTIDYLTLE